MFKFKKMLVTLGAFSGLLLAGASASANSIYTVKQGDTLSEIALNNGTTIQDILNLNQSITNPNVISAGEQITLPDGQTVQQAQQTTQVAQTQPVAQQPVQQVQQATTQQTSATQTQTVVSNQGGSNLGSAAEQIAQAESGGDYNARNGQYVGKYQLSASYLNGDYSPANQDRVFQQYCNQRYGSVENALAFRQSHGWY
ncbi:LysM peptidoglycan-binding domain-containing protein [uncultured Megamonas sp.]|uniref:aggregation-promoting factor n=1 Tax=uncultured Megamonas sp. TaxID=286140 RepID=UPI00259BAD90|nr:LysM peptidoglycan-binding domain-containing protein [uncultured Megamonas sp.]